MGDFFEHGTHLQRASASVREANRRYGLSCNICCSRGYRMDCDRCPIAVSNKETVEVLTAMQSAPRHVGQRQKGAITCMV